MGWCHPNRGLRSSAASNESDTQHLSYNGEPEGDNTLRLYFLVEKI
jgi:hypothetical protein